MSPDSMFEPTLFGNDEPSKKRVVKRQTIVKCRNAKEANTVVVDIPDEVSGKTRLDFVQPIMEGSRVVGVVHTCGCGKSTEILFEFDNQSELEF